MQLHDKRAISSSLLHGRNLGGHTLNYALIGSILMENFDGHACRCPVVQAEDDAAKASDPQSLAQSVLAHTVCHRRHDGPPTTRVVLFGFARRLETRCVRTIISAVGTVL